MALISTMPNPLASANSEPLIPEKMKLARTFTWASPPVICDTRARGEIEDLVGDARSVHDRAGPGIVERNGHQGVRLGAHHKALGHGHEGEVSLNHEIPARDTAARVKATGRANRNRANMVLNRKVIIISASP